MQVYDGIKPMEVVSKADDSPVTAADIAAHKVILKGLQALTPDIPVLSEEAPQSWEERQHWQRYWLVDPLDGTKEFIKRNGEFTVNIALIEKGKAVLGVVYAPVMKVMYSAAEGKAWKEECGVRKQIQVRDARPPLVVISRSHSDSELQEYLQTVSSVVVDIGASNVEELMAQMREADAAYAKRLDAVRGERDALAGERATLEGEKTAALKDLDASHRRADKAEALLEKVKSAFNV